MGTMKPEAWEAMLTRMEREGIGFYLNGKPSGTREIIRRCCVREWTAMRQPERGACGRDVCFGHRPLAFMCETGHNGNRHATGCL